jgi:hypothetical protein
MTAYAKMEESVIKLMAAVNAKKTTLGHIVTQNAIKKIQLMDALMIADV